MVVASSVPGSRVSDSGVAVVVAWMLETGDVVVAAVAWTSSKAASSSQAQVGRFTLVLASGTRVTLVPGSSMCWYARAASISGVMASSCWGDGGSPLSTQKGRSVHDFPLEIVRLVGVLDPGPEHSLAVFLDVVVLVAGVVAPAELVLVVALHLADGRAGGAAHARGVFFESSMLLDVFFLKSLAPR